MGKIIQTKNGPYRMRYRPEPIGRLARYLNWARPPPMTDEPPEAHEVYEWEKWEKIVYQWAMDRKHGKRRPVKQVGLWQHAEVP